MPGQNYFIPYSKNQIEFTLPPFMQATEAVSREVEPLKDTYQAIQQALEFPIGSSPLSKLARPGDRVCIVFTDVTRSCPDHLLVSAILDELRKAGIRSRDITLLCGTGMHRPSTQEEKIAKLGADIVTQYKIIDHEPQNPAVLVDLGFTSSGVPVLIHQAAVEADLLITTGIVEPHLYAGYSGGPKTVAIGAAGEGLIAQTHSPTFIDHPATRLGRVDGNPFHEVVSEVARRAGLCFILNVVQDDNKRVSRVAAGDPQLAFQDLVNFARSMYEVSLPHKYDIAIGGVGFPKDSNLYQASRAPTYLFFAPTPVVRPGGYMIIPARCEEGAGSGVGEQRFLSALRDAPSVQAILEDARRNGYPPGQQRAFVLAKVLEQVNVIVVGSEYPDLVEDCKMIQARSMEEALKLAGHSLGRSCQVLVVPHAMLTLPVIHSSSEE